VVDEEAGSPMGSSSGLQHHTGEPRVRPSARGGAWVVAAARIWWIPAGQTAEVPKAAINGQEEMAAEPLQEALGVSKSRAALAPRAASRRWVWVKPHWTAAATSGGAGVGRRRPNRPAAARASRFGGGRGRDGKSNRSGQRGRARRGGPEPHHAGVGEDRNRTGAGGGMAEGMESRQNVWARVRLGKR
jgi:hypothetical protein